jgi:hypothetical protein
MVVEAYMLAGVAMITVPETLPLGRIVVSVMGAVNMDDPEKP